MQQLKRFLEWVGLKEKLHALTAKPPRVAEHQIWWASLGENIGSEINGKNFQFSRPVIIFKKLAHGFYLVIPTTTKEHTGTWYVLFRQKGTAMVACLHQIRVIDYRRLSSQLGELDDTDFKRVRDGFNSLYK
ncbi:type II toxin-antitoxin system PemK/MazF family toxin [Candidatus Kaiserbacteria bacterium]|nr:type II toxin-antitoxin system PemK/MazF family toxin [Candidatus Kaiserbacteria bacterium]